VEISGFAFNPSSLTVAKGTTVTWTNNNNVAHTIVSDSGAFSSSELAKGGSFSFTFDSPGEYPYHCSIHPSMKGKVIVN